MSNTNILIIVGIAVVGFFILKSGKLNSAFGAINDVPTLKEFTSQKEEFANPNQNSVGAIGLTEGKATDSSNLQNTIVTGKLFTEDAIRQYINAQLTNKQINTDTGSGTQTKSVPQGGISIFRSKDSEIRVLDAFTPIGNANVVGIRGKLVSKQALARKVPTFQAVIKTKARGEREILVSEKALKRLQDNLSRSTGV